LPKAKRKNMFLLEKLATTTATTTSWYFERKVR
jgi:hypothetical protein